METTRALFGHDSPPVVSLPMRDGNSDHGPDRGPPPAVVSLPMRDGNFFRIRLKPWPMRVVSLPMRDGNSSSSAMTARWIRLLAYL